jgi:uncharacterized membrane protein
MRPILLYLHLLAAFAWVGGMFFAYFCLRPAAAQVLAPPQRLPLWVATFARFLRYTAIAVAILLLTGFAMFFEVGFRFAPPGWHVMFALGLVMTAVFAFVHLALYPRLRARCEAADWPAAAKTLNSIRQLVALNLALGVLVVAAAVSAR